MLVKKHSALDLLLYGSITIAFKVTVTDRIKSLDPDSGSLPASLRQSDMTASQFKKLLKTHLFS